MKEEMVFTSEAVSEGHPDKVCDQIADAILDACLALDPQAHVAIECFAAKQKLLIGGEVRFSSPSIHRPDIKAIAKSVMQEIGYTDPNLDFSVNEVEIYDWVQTQSEDINQAVSKAETTAGDQGLMFGYATDETAGKMPLAIVLAQKLVRVASKLRKQGQFPYARPDMKSQVTVAYQGKKIKVSKIVMSIQHDPKTPFIEFKDFVLEKIIKPVAQSFHLNTDYEVYINPSDRFVIGGPAGDTGLTGRKIIVDTYGGYARHGGGSFSGKDATKVDRSGAYLARYIALNLVEAGVAKKVEIQIAYVIGQAEPVSLTLFTFGTLKKGLTESQVMQAVKKVFFFKPGEIIKRFSLNQPTFKYRDLAIYGHFGRPDLDVPWEKTDKVAEIQNLLF
ncbi:MAG: methionine adenosyltransferase [Bacilli bacterium]